MFSVISRKRIAKLFGKRVAFCHFFFFNTLYTEWQIRLYTIYAILTSKYCGFVIHFSYQNYLHICKLLRFLPLDSFIFDFASLLSFSIPKLPAILLKFFLFFILSFYLVIFSLISLISILRTRYVFYCLDFIYYSLEAVDRVFKSLCHHSLSLIIYHSHPE